MLLKWWIHTAMWYTYLLLKYVTAQLSIIMARGFIVALQSKSIILISSYFINLSPFEIFHKNLQSDFTHITSLSRDKDFLWLLRHRHEHIIPGMNWSPKLRTFGESRWADSWLVTVGKILRFDADRYTWLQWCKGKRILLPNLATQLYIDKSHCKILRNELANTL